MHTDTLAPCVTKASASMILTAHKRHIGVIVIIEIMNFLMTLYAVKLLPIQMIFTVGH